MSSFFDLIRIATTSNNPEINIPVINIGTNVFILVKIVSLLSPTPSPSESFQSEKSRGRASTESEYVSFSAVNVMISELQQGGIYCFERLCFLIVSIGRVRFK